MKWIFLVWFEYWLMSRVSENSRNWNNYYDWFCFHSYRLLDVAHGQRLEREMSLYLIFEHLYCDLSEYLADRPVLGDSTIKVNINLNFNIIFCHIGTQIPESNL